MTHLGKFLQTSNLAYWPQLRWVYTDLLKQVSAFYIYDDTNILLWTNEGLVYRMQNVHKCIGGYTFKNDLSVDPLKTLDGQCVKQVDSAGSGCVAVLTTSGLLYTWGDNWFGQTGLGGQDKVELPCLVERDIQLVCCVDQTTWVVDFRGLLSWCGRITHNTSYQNLKRVFPGNIPNVVNLCCRSGNGVFDCSKVLALTANNFVYCWKWSHERGWSSPIAALLTSSIVVKTICPLDQTHFVICDNQNKILFSLYPDQPGAILPNTHQLALTTSNVHQVKPTKSELAYGFHMHLDGKREAALLALEDSSQYYLTAHQWLIPVHKPDALFALHCGATFTTPTLVIIHPDALEKLDDPNSPKFNDPRIANLVLTCDNELRALYLERAILEKVTSKSLRELLNNRNWSDPNHTLVILNDLPANFATLFAYFRYLYTGQLEVEHYDLLALLAFAVKWEETKFLSDIQAILSDHLCYLNANSQSSCIEKFLCNAWIYATQVAGLILTEEDALRWAVLCQPYSSSALYNEFSFSKSNSNESIPSTATDKKKEPSTLLTLSLQCITKSSPKLMATHDPHYTHDSHYPMYKIFNKHTQRK